MNIKSGLVFLIVLAAGLIGGTVAYQVATPTSSSAEPTANGTIVVPENQRRDKPPGFAPCKRPATLLGGKCVTDVTRTVVLPGAAAPAQSSGGRAPAPAPGPFHASGGDDEGRHHGGEGEEGHHGDDDGDDDDHDDTDTDTAFTDVTGTGTHHGGDDDDDDDVTHGDDDGHDDGGTQTRTRTHD